MAKTLRKLTAFTVAIVMCVCAASFTAMADEAITIAASGTTTITTATQMTCTGGQENHGGTGNYGFCTGAKATATINVAEAGIYTVEATGTVRANKDSTYNILVDGDVAAQFTFWSNGESYTIEVADIELTAGTHELQLEYVAKEGNYNYLTELKFTKKASDTAAVWVKAENGTSLGSSAAAHEMFYVMVGGSVQYTVNAPKAGTYQMAMKVARVDSANNNYTVSVNGFEATGEKSILPQNNSGIDPFETHQVMANMCEVDLKAGDNTVVFANNGSFMYFSYFKFDYLREAVSKDMRMQVRTYKNAYNAENGNAELRQDGGNPDNTLWQVNGWAEYEIEVSEPASYDVGLSMGGSPGGAQSYKIYVDGVQKIQNTVTPTYQTAYSERVDTVFGNISFFEAGTYTVKFLKTDGSFCYVDHVFFNYTGTVNRDIRMQVRTYKNAYNDQTGAGELKQDGGSPNNTLWQINGWAEYDIEIVSPGSYDVGLSLGGTPGASQTFIFYIDGNQKVENAVVPTYQTAYSERVDTVFGNISFYEAGTYTLKILKTDGAFCYCDHVFLNYVGEASKDIRMHVRSYTNAYNTVTGEGELRQDGSNPDNTIWQVGGWAEYSITIDEPGEYEVGIKMAGGGSEEAQTFVFGIDGIDRLTATAYTLNTDAYATKVDAPFGNISFYSAGTYTLKILKTDGNYVYASHIFLNYIGEPQMLTFGADEVATFSAKDYSSGYDVSKKSSAMTIEGGNVSFGTKDYIAYMANVEDEGLYLLSVTTVYGGGADTASYDILIDGESVYRQYLNNYGWFEQEALDSYIYIPSGIHELRFSNCGPDFYLCEISVEYQAPILAALDGDTDLSDYDSAGASGVRSGDSENAFVFDAEDAGLYKLTFDVTRTNVPVSANIYSNERGLLSVINFAKSSSPATYSAVLKLDEGINVIKYRMANGVTVLSGMSLEFITWASDEELTAVAKTIENASSADEIYSIIKANEDTLGVDIDEATGDIQYSEYVFMRLLNKKYMNGTAFLDALYGAINAEKTSPSLSTAVENGKITATVKSDIYTADGTFILSVYRNGRMISANTSAFTVGDTITLSADYAEGDTVKFLCFNSLDGMQPIDLADSVYKNIYVSPEGSDEGDGTESSPYRTIAAAKEAVADLRSSMTGDIVVNIAPGYYELSETEEFTEDNGGIGNYRVIYKGTDSANHAVISGGKKVTGWTSVGNGIYSAPFTGTYVRDLYVNGYPAVRARSASVYQFSSKEDKTLVADVTGINTFSKPSDLVLVWNTDWVTQYTPVVSLTKSGNTLTFTMDDTFTIDPGTENIRIGGSSGWHPTTYDKFYIENALELLDTTGEFYYDESAQRIYYKPYSQENIETAEVYASQLDTVVSITGSDTLSKVKNIAFENLDFKYGAWNNNAIMHIQSDQYIISRTENAVTYGKVPAQVNVNYADNVEIKNCEFSCLGSTALALSEAVTNSKVNGNIFRDLGGGAISIGNFEHVREDGEGKACTEIEISDNVIRRTGIVWRGMPALASYYESNINILRNDIADTSYSGMSIGWGWGTANSKFGNITIANNKVKDVMQLLTDGGHIYTLGDMPGTVIKNNYLTGTKDGRGGVYNDSGSGSLDILDNVVDCYVAGGSYWWFQGVYYTHDMHAEGNFSHSRWGIQARADAINNTAANNTEVLADGSWDGAGNAAAQAIIDGSGVSDEFKTNLNSVSLPSWRESPWVVPGK